MVKKAYQLEIPKEHTARAYTANAGVSLKYATEICNQIKGKQLSKAEAFLGRVVSHEEFLPLLKYSKKVAHRKGESKSGVKAGRYPEKTCEAFIGLLGSVKANADFKGLDQEKLQIVHAFASMGFKRSSFQSKGKISGKRRRKKSTHIEVIVREAK